MLGLGNTDLSCLYTIVGPFHCHLCKVSLILIAACIYESQYLTFVQIVNNCYL